MTDFTPNELKQLDQWVAWLKDKRPVQPNLKPASSTSPETWNSYESVRLCCDLKPQVRGVGFVFSPEDPYTGIDFDGCRDPKTGLWAGWAKEWIKRLNSYAELSPSGTGAKVIVRAQPVFDSGKKVNLDVPAVCEKTPGIEIYSSGRYFTITGQKLCGVPRSINQAQEALEGLKGQFFVDTISTAEGSFVAKRTEHPNPPNVIERARMYVAKMEPAVSGSGGHDRTFAVACVLCLGFGLNESEAMILLTEYNRRCLPQWSEKELRHKITSAMKQPGERNYLRNATQDEWPRIPLPKYGPNVTNGTLMAPTVARMATDPVELGNTTLSGLMARSVENIDSDEVVKLYSTGLGELDDALGGGVAMGEEMVIAARPSHGKTALGLQIIHEMAKQGVPSLFINEEMTEDAISNRSLRQVTAIDPEDWSDRKDDLETEIDWYKDKHSECWVESNVRTTDKVLALIDQHYETNDVRLVVVDYAQLVEGYGKGQYEKVSDMSRRMKAVTKKMNIITILLCQLGRDIEKRKEFVPGMHDLKESGQIEQDADIILGLVYPKIIDPMAADYDFFIHVLKNKERGIRTSQLNLIFNPKRLRITESAYNYSSHKNYHSEFDQ